MSTGPRRAIPTAPGPCVSPTEGTEVSRGRLTRSRRSRPAGEDAPRPCGGACGGTALPVAEGPSGVFAYTDVVIESWHLDLLPSRAGLGDLGSSDTRRRLQCAQGRTPRQRGGPAAERTRRASGLVCPTGAVHPGDSGSGGSGSAACRPGSSDGRADGWTPRGCRDGMDSRAMTGHRRPSEWSLGRVSVPLSVETVQTTVVEVASGGSRKIVPCACGVADWWRRSLPARVCRLIGFHEKEIIASGGGEACALPGLPRNPHPVFRAVSATGGQRAVVSWIDSAGPRAVDAFSLNDAQQHRCHARVRSPRLDPQGDPDGEPVEGVGPGGAVRLPLARERLPVGVGATGPVGQVVPGRVRENHPLRDHQSQPAASRGTGRGPAVRNS